MEAEERLQDLKRDSKAGIESPLRLQVVRLHF